MEDAVKQLLELQDIDIKIDRIKDRKAVIPQEIEKLKRDLADAEKELESFVEYKENKEKELKGIYKEIDDTQDRLTRYQQQLLEVKTNEEYTSMLHQIEKEKKSINELEDRALELMEELESLKDKEEDINETLGRKRKDIQNSLKKLEEELQSMDRDLLIKYDERKRKSAKLNSQLLVKYEKLRNARGGKVLVTVIKDSCEGCNASMPIEQIEKLKSEGAIGKCENCGRMIIWKNEIP